MQGQSHKRVLRHTFNLIEQYFKGSRATFKGENEKLSYSEGREISLILKFSEMGLFCAKTKKANITEYLLHTYC